MPGFRGLSTLLVAALLSGAAVGQTPAPDYPALVGQLAADDFQTRERAGVALLQAGEAAIPDLKAALAKVADPEAVRRLHVVLERLESNRLGEPRRVTLKVERKPAKEVFAELARQTGYKFRLDATIDKPLVTFDWAGTPFLQAVDQLCDVLQLNSTVEDPDGTVHIFDGDQVHPHVAYAGPFRIVATTIGSNRNAVLGGFSRRNPLQRQPDYVNLGVVVEGEPKACLCALGQPNVVRATDELKNSLLRGEDAALGDEVPPVAAISDLPVPAFRSHTSGASFTLIRVARQADYVKECHVKLSVAVLAEARPEIAVADVAKAQGQKFTGHTHLLEVGPTGVQNNSATVAVTVRRKQPVEGDDNYSWVNTTQQRFEAFDAEGRALRFNGVAEQNNEPNAVRLTLQFVRPAVGQKPPKIAKLHLVEWVVQHKSIEFTLKDLPLP